MKPVLATYLILAMTLSHGASALCGHPGEAASSDHRLAHDQSSDPAAKGHHVSGSGGDHHDTGGRHHGNAVDVDSEPHGSDADTERDGHGCGTLMDCGPSTVAPSASAPSHWAGGSSFVVRHLTGSLESELPPTESPPPRRS